MNIFIITTARNRFIVEKLKKKLSQHIVSSSLENGIAYTNYTSFVEKKLRFADGIIVFLDNSLLQEESCLLMVEQAQKLTRVSDSRRLLIAKSDDVSVPDFLRKEESITLNSNENRNISKIKKWVKEGLRKDLTSYKSTSIFSTVSGVVFSILIGFFVTFAGDYIYDLNITNLFLNFRNHIQDNHVFLIVLMISVIMELIVMMVLLYKKAKMRSEESNAYFNKLNHVVTTTNIGDNFPLGSKDKAKDPPKNEMVFSQPSIDALGLMLVNLDDINKFYRWSRKQAKSSFIFAIVMCVAGFLLIASAIVLSFVLKISDTALIISVVGGAITELISATSLLVYRTSLKQLNYYHKALHEDERFLSSINLIDKFKSSENYDEMLKEIIKSEIQLNILETKQEPDKRYTVKVKKK